MPKYATARDKIVYQARMLIQDADKMEDRLRTISELAEERSHPVAEAVPQLLALLEMTRDLLISLRARV